MAKEIKNNMQQKVEPYTEKDVNGDIVDEKKDKTFLDNEDNNNDENKQISNENQ